MCKRDTHNRGRLLQIEFVPRNTAILPPFSNTSFIVFKVESAGGNVPKSRFDCFRYEPRRVVSFALRAVDDGPHGGRGEGRRGAVTLLR